jgi:hypothetical protein
MVYVHAAGEPDIQINYAREILASGRLDGRARPDACASSVMRARGKHRAANNSIAHTHVYVGTT